MRRDRNPYETDCLPLDAIDVEDRLRPLDQAHVRRLAASIRAIGLQTPITVRYDRDPDAGGRALLVAGAHRLAALRELGETDARVFVANDDPDFAMLWEIEENFARQELSDAQRADHHARREAILVRRGEVAAPGKGGDRRSTAKSAVGPSYARHAAEQLGASERTVRQDLRRGKSIAPDVLREVEGTSLDRGVVLDELASTPREEQPAKLAEIVQRRAAPPPSPSVTTIADRAEAAPPPAELEPTPAEVAGEVATPPTPTHGSAAQVVLDAIGPEATAALARVIGAADDNMRGRFRAVISAAASRLRAEQLAGDAAPPGRWRAELNRAGELVR